MGSLTELARIAKSDPYAAQPKRIPGQTALTVGGAGVAGAGGILALKARKLPERSTLAAQQAGRRANELNRRAMAKPRSKSARKIAERATYNAEIAGLSAHNAPAKAKWLRRAGAKGAVIGGAAMAGGYGIKRLNNGA
jgi:2-methylisocitrate lyase-like PEP mutase family enzyme